VVTQNFEISNTLIILETHKIHFHINICVLIHLTLTFTCRHLTWHALLYRQSDMSQIISCPIYVRCFRKYGRLIRRGVWKAGYRNVAHRKLHNISRNLFVYLLNFLVVSPALRWSHCLNYIGLFTKIPLNTLI
jgi:hypothetical protein